MNARTRIITTNQFSLHTFNYLEVEIHIHHNNTRKKVEVGFLLYFLVFV